MKKCNSEPTQNSNSVIASVAFTVLGGDFITAVSRGWNRGTPVDRGNRQKFPRAKSLAKSTKPHQVNGAQ